MHERISVFQDRLPERAKNAPQNSGLDRLAYAVLAANGSIERFDQAYAAIKQNGNLSDLGKARAAVEPAKAELHNLHRQRQEVAKVRADMANHRLSLRPPQPDKTDLAGALIRQEIRAMVRAMPLSERVAFALSAEELEVMQALLHAPDVLTGLPADIKARVVEKYQEANFGPILAELADAEEAADCAEAALSTAVGVIATTSQIDGREFAELNERIANG